MVSVGPPGSHMFGACVSVENERTANLKVCQLYSGRTWIAKEKGGGGLKNRVLIWSILQTVFSFSEISNDFLRINEN